MRSTKTKFILSFCLSAVLFSSCGDDGPSGPDSSEGFTVTLSVSNLEPLNAGEGHYELWISFPDDDDDAFDFDFSGASAHYVLDTPTTISGSDFNSGL